MLGRLLLLGHHWLIPIAQICVCHWGSIIDPTSHLHKMTTSLQELAFLSRCTAPFLKRLMQRLMKNIWIDIWGIPLVVWIDNIWWWVGRMGLTTHTTMIIDGIQW